MPGGSGVRGWGLGWQTGRGQLESRSSDDDLDPVGRPLRLLVLPDHDNSPAVPFQSLDGLPVAFDVGRQLARPPAGIGPRQGAVDRTRVPEATPYVDHDSAAGKEDVLAPAQLGQKATFDPIAKAAAVQLAAQQHLRSGVPASLRPQASPGRLR